MIGGDRIRDRLQQHRLACPRRRHDQAALTLTDRRKEIEYPCGKIILGGLELQSLVGIERRQIIEEDLVASLVGMLEIDGFNFDQCEVSLSVLRRTYLSGYRIACAQIELADLRRRHVDVVRSGKIVVIRGSEKSKTVR